MKARLAVSRSSMDTALPFNLSMLGSRAMMSCRRSFSSVSFTVKSQHIKQQDVAINNVSPVKVTYFQFRVNLLFTAQAAMLAQY